jgi:endogenous inhibitor of DNA gyrase (YacG/DUF329 family)
MTEAPEKGGRCAVCGRPRETQAYRPFCSKRCADVDLRRWLSNGYVVPEQPAEDGGAGAFDEHEEG